MLIMPSEPEPLHDGTVDASHLISNDSTDTAAIVCTVKVKPNDQQRCPLGEYAPDARLRGFSVELTPDPDPENSVVTQITNNETAKKQRLHLHIANYGSKTVTAIVRQL
jgi:hypothetical protein